MGLFNRFRRRVKETVDASTPKACWPTRVQTKPTLPCKHAKRCRNNLQPRNRPLPATTIGTTQRTTLSLRLRRWDEPEDDWELPEEEETPAPAPWPNPVGKHRWRRRSNFA